MKVSGHGWSRDYAECGGRRADDAAVLPFGACGGLRAGYDAVLHICRLLGHQCRQTCNRNPSGARRECRAWHRCFVNYRSHLRCFGLAMDCFRRKVCESICLGRLGAVRTGCTDCGRNERNGMGKYRRNGLFAVGVRKARSMRSERMPDSRVLCFSCPVRDYVASARAALAIAGESVE